MRAVCACVCAFACALDISMHQPNPVQDAISLIQQGKFSASARMNRFLTNINKVPLTVKHLSSKFQLNEVADHQSRNPSSCSVANCLIHRFIGGLTDTVVDAAAKCAAVRTGPCLTSLRLIGAPLCSSSSSRRILS